MNYSPSIKPLVCDSNVLTIYDTVRSFFNNYVYYKWQRSTDGGINWFDVTAPSGPASPFWNGTAWEYVTSYTVPPSLTQLSNNGDKYRLVVATTFSNLSNINCRFTDNMNIITINVIDCGDILTSNLLSFSGKIVNNRALLKWMTSYENEKINFTLERSDDGINFYQIATMNGYNDPAASLNTYIYTDPVPLKVNTIYRLHIKNNSGKTGYSKMVLLSPAPPDVFITAKNPFNNELLFDIYTTNAEKAVTELMDANGKIVKRKTIELNNGINNCKIENTETLISGIYFLRTQFSSGKVLLKKVIKLLH
jgi:hypothetical protein